MLLVQLWLGMLLASLSMVGFIGADYHIGIVVLSIVFEEPMNSLSDGSCCDSSCGANQTCCAATSCSPTLRLCFRESQRSRDDTDSECPILEVDRTVAQQVIILGTGNAAVERYYTGDFQVYIRLSHSEDSTPDFMPPFTDPLIDEAFVEFFQLPAVPYSERRMQMNQNMTAEGRFGLVTVTIQASVHCANGWNGTACEVLCNSTCTQVLAPPPTTPPPTTPTPPPTTPTTISTSSPETEPLGGGNGNNNVVAIAVGVSVGVVAFLFLVICVIVIIVVVKRKTKWGRTYKIETASYTLKMKTKKSIKKADIKVIPSMEPLNRGQLYASIKKKKKADGDNESDQESPPPVPPYMPAADMDDYVAMQGTNGVVYQNFASVNKEI